MYAHSIGALYHIPHGKAIAWCLLPVVKAQENQRYDRIARLYWHCHPEEAPAVASGAGESTGENAAATAYDTADTVAAADRFILETAGLLEMCGLEKSCDLLKTEDFDKLVKMIDADSINYSPSRTLSDNEIRMLLDQIRRGY